MNKNYYDILDISPNATEAEIKTAFRKYANKHHPDKKGGNENLFQLGAQAKDTLLDPSKKRFYDSSLKNPEKATDFRSFEEKVDALSRALHPMGQRFSTHRREIKEPYTFQDAIKIKGESFFKVNRKFSPEFNLMDKVVNDPRLKAYIGIFAGIGAFASLPTGLPFFVDTAFSVLIGSTTALATGYALPMLTNKVIPTISNLAEGITSTLSKTFWAATNKVPGFSQGIYKAAFTSAAFAATFFMPDAAIQMTNLESTMSAFNKNPISNFAAGLDSLSGAGQLQTIAVGGLGKVASCVTAFSASVGAINEIQDFNIKAFSTLSSIDIKNDSMLWEAGQTMMMNVQPYIEPLMR